MSRIKNLKNIIFAVLQTVKNEPAAAIHAR